MKTIIGAILFFVVSTAEGHNIHPGLQWSCLQPWIGFTFSTPMSEENFIYLTKEAEDLCGCINETLSERFEIEHLNSMDTTLQKAITNQITENVCVSEYEHLKDTVKKITDDVKRESQQ